MAMGPVVGRAGTGQDPGLVGPGLGPGLVGPGPVAAEASGRAAVQEGGPAVLVLGWAVAGLVGSAPVAAGPEAAMALDL
ncbi:hypothetical protein [Actinomadura sp. 6N118]|uniref:hypothetical protein n=1 Tax=Actinomadura sp. 6N118 TaxID=3375151 RepID=UPI00378D005C